MDVGQEVLVVSGTQGMRGLGGGEVRGVGSPGRVLSRKRDHCKTKSTPVLLIY